MPRKGKANLKIIYKKGDLLEAPEKYILHGCNAQGKMGPVIAAMIKAKYPIAYLAYKASEQYGGMKLGRITYAGQEDGKVIINGITQEFYGRNPNIQYVDYWAMREVMQGVDWLMHNWAERMGHVVPVAMPLIGAGHGGGDWNIIEKIIEEESVHFQAVVYQL